MERDFIQWLQKRLPPHPNLLLGPGDDAAILALGAARGMVVTSDLLSEGVHFVLQDAGSQRVGRKALAVNLSDLAAMAARPVAAVVCLLLPHSHGARIARELFEGMLPLAAAHDVSIAGGDTNCWDGPLVVSVTLIGEASGPHAFRRAAAQVGDAILVTGKLGGSELGHHLDFEPRVQEALLLNEQYTIHAAMDISDGLTLDLSRICDASEVGAELELAAIPVSAAAHELARDSDRDALRHALSDGEDFELLFTVSQAEAERILHDQPLDVPLTRIGSIISERRMWQVESDGCRNPIAPAGFEHGAMKGRNR